MIGEERSSGCEVKVLERLRQIRVRLLQLGRNTKGIGARILRAEERVCVAGQGSRRLR